MGDCAYCKKELNLCFEKSGKYFCSKDCVNSYFDNIDGYVG